MDGAGANHGRTGYHAFVLTGENTYSGVTEIQSGTLVVNGLLSHSTVVINNGATLKGVKLPPPVLMSPPVPEITPPKLVDDPFPPVVSVADPRITLPPLAPPPASDPIELERPFRSRAAPLVFAKLSAPCRPTCHCSLATERTQQRYGVLGLTWDSAHHGAVGWAILVSIANDSTMDFIAW